MQKKKKLSSKERGIKKGKEMILRDIKIMYYTCLTYPLVIPVPGQVPFGAVVISNLLVTSSFETEKKMRSFQWEMVYYVPWRKQS